MKNTLLKSVAVVFLSALVSFVAGCSGQRNIDPKTKALPRAESPEMNAALDSYLKAMEEAGQELHSVMVLQHGKVLAEKWLNEGSADKPHTLYSVSKTFTATAVGLAIDEGKLKLTDTLISFFPDKLPAEVSDNLAAITVRDLLTMNCGHETERLSIRDKEDDWVREFLSDSVPHKPGTCYTYNSMGTYMLSAIVQEVTGEKIADYLQPRLFGPLGIENVQWEESPQGINTGGWGLSLRTEDLAKMGQLFLQKGMWNGERVLPEKWVEEASSRQVSSVHGVGVEPTAEEIANSDWVQGYGYQMWRCRHNAYRADGAYGQYILVIPDVDAVIAVTANLSNMQTELSGIWAYLLPALEASK